jgi:noranthrone synthase
MLIDSPPPKGLDHLPQIFPDAFGADLFGGAAAAVAKDTSQVQKKTGVPDLLLQYFKASIQVLHDFVADPLPEGLTPLTTIIRASES